MRDRDADGSGFLSPRQGGSSSKRVSDLRELEAIPAERTNLDEHERLAIDRARIRGATWEQIATALGLHHRQGAQQRLRRLREQSLRRRASLSAPAHEASHEDDGPDLEQRARRAVETAELARSELVNLDPRGVRTGMQRDLGTVTITVILIRRASEDLQKLQDSTGLSKTDLVNRAISLYEFIDAQQHAGCDFLLHDPSSGGTHRVTLL